MNNVEDLKLRFKEIIDDALESGDNIIFNMVFVSLISADNNITKEEIRENCEKIEVLINVLSEYPSDEKLQKRRKDLIKYNEIYWERV